MDNKQLTFEEKLLRRKMNNRISAQVARDRKKEFIQQLEDKIQKLEAEKKNLLEENKKLYQICEIMNIHNKCNKTDEIPALEVVIDSINNEHSISYPSPPYSPKYEKDDNLSLEKFSPKRSLHQDNPAEINLNPLPREKRMFTVRKSKGLKNALSMINLFCLIFTVMMLPPIQAEKASYMIPQYIPIHIHLPVIFFKNPSCLTQENILTLMTNRNMYYPKPVLLI